MVNTFNLKDRIALITGGYGYLGTAITTSLSFHGATVYVLGRNPDKFKLSFSRLEKDLVKNIHFRHCDVSDTESVKGAFSQIHAETGDIDILINNAFYSKGQSAENMTDDEWDYGIKGTLGSVFRCIREVIPYFKNKGSGKIINVSSMYGMYAPQFEVYKDYPEFLNPPQYGAAKAGILQLTRYYASYLGNLNINVNSITPGPFPSDEVKKHLTFIKKLEEKTCLGRIGSPEDLSGAFVFLASGASDFITGQNIVVDGGWTAK